MANNQKRAFSFFEMLLAIVILFLLIMLVVVNVNKLSDEKTISDTNTFVKSTLGQAIISYRVDMGRYPTTQEGLRVLIKAPKGDEKSWGGPYLNFDEMPKDIWGNDYEYRFPAQKSKNAYDVWSKGEDGVSFTEDDIANW